MEKVMLSKHTISRKADRYTCTRRDMHTVDMCARTPLCHGVSVLEIHSQPNYYKPGKILNYEHNHTEHRHDNIPEVKSSHLNTFAKNEMRQFLA